MRDIDEPFADVLKALDMKAMRRAMRGAMLREGNRLRRAAAANLGSSGIGHGTRQRLARGIRVRVFPERYGAGFMLSVKPRKRKGYHKNRAGKEKPVLMWAEDGTDLRRTKTRTRAFARKRRGHETGRMRRYGFMARTERQEAGKVESELFGEFRRKLRIKN